MRRDFRDRATVLTLVNFNELRIFESALGQANMVTILKKAKAQSTVCRVAVTKRTGFASPTLLRNILHNRDPETFYRGVPQNELYEPNTLYISSVNAGLTSADSISKILKKLAMQQTRLRHVCNLSQGVVTGLDRISKKHLKKLPRAGLMLGQGCYVLTESERRLFVDGDDEIIKPYFKNSDIHKYTTERRNSKWLIHATTDLDITKHKAVYKHLLSHRRAIESRNFDSGELSKASKLGAWWALSSARKDFDFTVPKIVCPQRSFQNTFGYNEIAWYGGSDLYYITQKGAAVSLKYILALLNSKLYFAWLYLNTTLLELEFGRKIPFKDA